MAATNSLGKADLRKVTSETGGRFYLVDSLEELDAAYAQINAELRSQYLLAFSTSEPLDRQELDAIRVEVEGRGLKVRTVTLSR